MSTPPSQEMHIIKPGRAPWRQRLVDAETGFRLGLRTDSTLFVYVLMGSMTLASGAVLGIEKIEWIALVLTFGLTLSVELFHQLLKFLVQEFQHHLRKDVHQMLRLGTAACLVTNIAAATVLGIIFGSRIWHLFS
ncbi:diacylglycerol kinase [Thalassoglobus sp.]|uniref:diacylglycerol kinase n=1 Tax=Thalassoglobus sp. TaxID=2795869 RepID=UPI003AA8119A